MEENGSNSGLLIVINKFVYEEVGLANEIGCWIKKYDEFDKNGCAKKDAVEYARMLSCEEDCSLIALVDHKESSDGTHYKGMIYCYNFED